MAAHKVVAEITGRVWKIIAGPGTKVDDEEVIILIESMKMEIPVLSPGAGTVTAILVGEGDDVAEGQEVAILES
jgi:acetyl-CoA carboxylase biotin carboxyl carrier protein